MQQKMKIIKSDIFTQFQISLSPVNPAFDGNVDIYKNFYDLYKEEYKRRISRKIL